MWRCIYWFEKFQKEQIKLAYVRESAHHYGGSKDHFWVPLDPFGERTTMTLPGGGTWHYVFTMRPAGYDPEKYGPVPRKLTDDSGMDKVHYNEVYHPRRESCLINCVRASRRDVLSHDYVSAR